MKPDTKKMTEYLLSYDFSVARRERIRQEIKRRLDMPRVPVRGDVCGPVVHTPDIAKKQSKA